MCSGRLRRCSLLRLRGSVTTKQMSRWRQSAAGRFNHACVASTGRRLWHPCSKTTDPRGNTSKALESLQSAHQRLSTGSYSQSHRDSSVMQAQGQEAEACLASPAAAAGLIIVPSLRALLLTTRRCSAAALSTRGGLKSPARRAAGGPAAGCSLISRCTSAANLASACSSSFASR